MVCEAQSTTMNANAFSSVQHWRQTKLTYVIAHRNKAVIEVTQRASRRLLCRSDESSQQAGRADDLARFELPRPMLVPSSNAGNMCFPLPAPQPDYA